MGEPKLTPEDNAELMAVIELLARHLADPSDDRECDCQGEGLDWEGSEWTLCECVLKKVDPAYESEDDEQQRVEAEEQSREP